ncbi:hypothetical protein KHA80_15915 [Anaerobacillus sp. HL2]|nr:hypothetical protein KHA80_15915 [Anaerobacillus sp. HL2]
MKKMFFLVLFALILIILACGNKTDENNEQDGNQEVEVGGKQAIPKL